MRSSVVLPPYETAVGLAHIRHVRPPRATVSDHPPTLGRPSDHLPRERSPRASSDDPPPAGGGTAATPAWGRLPANARGPGGPAEPSGDAPAFRCMVLLWIGGCSCRGRTSGAAIFPVPDMRGAAAFCAAVVVSATGRAAACCTTRARTTTTTTSPPRAMMTPSSRECATSSCTCSSSSCAAACRKGSWLAARRC